MSVAINGAEEVNKEKYDIEFGAQISPSDGSENPEAARICAASTGTVYYP